MSEKLDSYKLTQDHQSWTSKPATLEEWQIVNEWALAEKWDLGLGDTECFFNIDDQGFYLGYVNGEPVASVSVVNYSDEYAYAGFYLVAPGARGKGYGLRLSYDAFHHCDKRSVGLDGMPEQEENYKKGGFVTHYETSRLVGVHNQQVDAPQGVQNISADNIEAVIEFDAQITGYSRAALLQNWFSGEGRHGFLIDSGDGVLGVVGIRRSTDGYRLGPLYAENQAVSEKLFAMAMAQVPLGTQVTIDAPTLDLGFINTLKALGYEEIFHTFRMYRGTEPQGEKHKIQAIASLELG
ncbi:MULTISPECIES: GNAT family N-acetyltransferase [Pseudoalteromonas]|uniref:Acetyltransferase (GNAT) family n=1 Tax=Pseudoalteromonas luteoviolacea (strain 2ta16) TaxID=1353533 RepID=V4HKD0_PSEL2|nr:MULTISPECIES: GNAT family N-acetyltransferase [Pseudoalteromonas]ESP90238.1 acetyltransferase (GNAT) family [Pseudoalteromonas luteoviolacea 2ta16]KZN29923.1 hypothetical protein N483_06540 [Pseudoalteromonas luteoviolacea NCIMB 1944]MCG7550602.1 GNAT family N-acetyltransferase [Pseudoalteromonas sp. Of7M-16]